MSAFKPGDKARGREVDVEGVDGHLIRIRLAGEYVGWVPAALYEPVPQPDEDAIERAAEVIYDTWIDNGDCGRPNWMTEAGQADARDQARALAAAGLLASPVREPGGAEARLRDLTSRIGFGDGITEPQADNDTIVEFIESAAMDQRDHYECPIVCEGCGETLANTECPQCHGSGGNAAVIERSGAYQECEWCAGSGKVHEACAEKSYAELAALMREPGRSEAEVEFIDWLFSINYPFDMSWPLCPPPVDHRKLAKVWNERDGWRVSDDDAYLCICTEAGIEPDQVTDTEGGE